TTRRAAGWTAFCTTTSGWSWTSRRRGREPRMSGFGTRYAQHRGVCGEIHGPAPPAARPAPLQRRTDVLSWDVALLEPDEILDREVLTYKCETCGKIIGAPAGLEAPRCCEDPMKKIREWHEVAVAW